MSLPMNALVYTHRSGRTGRAGNKGRSILLAPIAGARRARRLLAEAGIESEWREIPSANAVRKQLKKRARRHLNKALTAEQSFDEGELEYAQRLLEGQDAAKVVAALVKRCQPDRHCEPQIVSSPPPPRSGRDDRRGPRRYESDDRRPNDRGRNTQPMTRFQINWGLHDGANPGPILALVCRRGNIDRSVIGAIDVGATSSTIEIATSIATRFESDARRPDPRNPNLRITRDGSALRLLKANGHSGNGSGYKTNGSKPNRSKPNRSKPNGSKGNRFKKRR